MRLVQKSLFHTGYFITADNRIIPAFTKDLVEEAMLNPKKKAIKKIYGVLSPKEINYVVEQINLFKQKHGVLPQNLTEFLRTGFATNGELKQSHNLFIYK